MTDALARARMMARIATPLLSATLRASAWQHSDGETLAQHFSQDINRVVPIAQALIAALKPENEREQDEVNGLAAPVAAQLIAQNPDLLGGDGEDLARFLKPSLNVLASFCDRESQAEPLADLDGALGQSLVALAPIVGALSRYAFGKSPAKRLTDALDALTRAQADLFRAMPAKLRNDGALRAAVMGASAQLFASHFEALMQSFDGREMDDPEARFKELLSQWVQSIGLLSVLLQHAAIGDIPMESGDNVKPLRARKPSAAQDDGDEEDEEARSGGGSGGGQKMKPGYNPMSFFSKKGV